MTPTSTSFVGIIVVDRYPEDFLTVTNSGAICRTLWVDAGNVLCIETPLVKPRVDHSAGHLPHAGAFPSLLGRGTSAPSMLRLAETLVLSPTGIHPCDNVLKPLRILLILMSARLLANDRAKNKDTAKSVKVPAFE